jgi:AraC-like DNA-binding protein
MESDRLVTHICYEVGFNNVANFNRRFLEIKGLTPTEFRRQADHRFGTRAATDAPTEAATGNPRAASPRPR